MIEITGKWYDIFSDGRSSDKWTSNLIVSNAKNVIAAALANVQTTHAFNVGGLNWDFSDKTLVRTGAFSTYQSQWSDNDYALIRYGTGISTGGSQFNIASVTNANTIVIDGDIDPGDVLDNSVSITIFKDNPRLHNLYLAIGTGSSTWDNESVYPDKSATSLLQEYYRKPITSVTHIKEYTGSISAVAGADITSSEFVEFGNDCVGQLLEIIDGPGVGQVRQIDSINTTTNVATLSSAITGPATTASKWRIGIPQFDPTGTIDITTVFNADEANANGTIREMGLFGGHANGVIGSGQMLNLIHHASITKTVGTSLTRIIRLRINIA